VKADRSVGQTTHELPHDVRVLDFKFLRRASPDGPVAFHYPAPDYFGELLSRGEIFDHHQRALAESHRGFEGLGRVVRFLLRLLAFTPSALLRSI